MTDQEFAGLVRDYLPPPGEDERYTTTRLGRVMWAEIVGNENIETPASLSVVMERLQKLAPTLLSDCATRGEPRKNTFGREVRPWLWHASDGTTPRAQAPKVPTLAERVTDLEKQVAEIRSHLVV